MQRLDKNDAEHHREVTVVYVADAGQALAPAEADWPGAAWEAQKAVKLAKVVAEREARKKGIEVGRASFFLVLLRLFFKGWQVCLTLLIGLANGRGVKCTRRGKSAAR